MRSLSQRIAGQFDVVMAFDNAIPHLLSDEDLHLAAWELRSKTRAGGLLLASTCDYDSFLEERPQLTSERIISTAEGIRMVFQVWEFHGAIYDLAMYFVVDDGDAEHLVTHVMRIRYNAVGTDHLLGLMRRAGFTRAERLDERFYQPVLVGNREV
jgi:hypothetical protein